MSEDQGSTIGTSLVVFLLGVAVGAAVAILYAPSAGAETRAKLSEAANKLKERAAELSHEVAEKAKEVRERVRPKEAGAEEESSAASGAAEA